MMNYYYLMRIEMKTKQKRIAMMKRMRNLMRRKMKMICLVTLMRKRKSCLMTILKTMIRSEMPTMKKKNC